MTDKDHPLYCPFTILVDTAEGAPFEFRGIRSDSRDGFRKFLIETRRCNLGRYPNSLGDYSIDGHFGKIAIERKSVEDIQGTVLGWDGRRERFEQEMRNLNQVDAPLVLVEGSLADVLRSMPRFGAKTREQNCKHFQRFLLRYFQDSEFRVPWVWCDTRRMAEVFAFRFLYRYWKKQIDK